MTDEIAAANKELVRQFYKEVYVDWNMALADEVRSPQFRSHNWPQDGPTVPRAFRDYYSAMRSAGPDTRYEVNDLIADRTLCGWFPTSTRPDNSDGSEPDAHLARMWGNQAIIRFRLVPAFAALCGSLLL